MLSTILFLLKSFKSKLIDSQFQGIGLTLFREWVQYYDYIARHKCTGFTPSVARPNRNNALNATVHFWKNSEDICEEFENC